ncbi:MAG TPA: hypothetical protein VNU26_15340 [Mycobacteriales bacterium]|nr:hypothetical protein [Mycobacteriales bacterium]
MYAIVAVVLLWLATSLVLGAVWALATYRRPPVATASQRPAPPSVLREMPRPRAESTTRRRDHAASR